MPKVKVKKFGATKAPKLSKKAASAAKAAEAPSAIYELADDAAAHGERAAYAALLLNKKESAALLPPTGEPAEMTVFYGKPGEYAAPVLGTSRTASDVFGSTSVFDVYGSASVHRYRPLKQPECTARTVEVESRFKAADRWYITTRAALQFKLGSPDSESSIT